MKLNAAKSLSTDLLSDYAVSEKIWAGYAMATLKLGRVTLVPRRARRAHRRRLHRQDLQQRRLSRGPDTTGSNKYTHWFPGLNAKMDVERAPRAARRRHHGHSAVPTMCSWLRPPRSTSPPTPSAPAIRNLKPLTSTNLDAGVEYYLPGQGVLSASVFAKDIQDPIFTRLLLNQTGTHGGVALTGARSAPR
ncbi:TonB-dependent receptor domain-containing protein [Caulobacter segnis]